MQYFDKNKPMQSFIPAVRDVLFSPKRFFADMPPAAFYSNSIFFLSILVFISSFIGVPFHDMALLFLLPVTWGIMLIGTKFWASYLSWAVRFFAKTKITSANAFQLSAYAAAPLLLTTIPVVGLLAGIWNLYLVWVALIARCKVAAGMAALIIAIPAVLFIGSVVALLGLATQMLPQLA